MQEHYLTHCQTDHIAHFKMIAVMYYLGIQQLCMIWKILEGALLGKSAERMARIIIGLSHFLIRFCLFPLLSFAAEFLGENKVLVITFLMMSLPA